MVCASLSFFHYRQSIVRSSKPMLVSPEKLIIGHTSRTHCLYSWNDDQVPRSITHFQTHPISHSWLCIYIYIIRISPFIFHYSILAYPTIFASIFLEYHHIAPQNARHSRRKRAWSLLKQPDAKAGFGDWSTAKWPANPGVGAGMFLWCSWDVPLMFLEICQDSLDIWCSKRIFYS